jgi:hypothetical protein
MRHHYRILVGAALIACLLAFVSITGVSAWAQCDSDAGCPTCSACCPKCKLEVSTENVKKHFYEVVCKDICIPKVTFPWQKPRCDKCDGGCDPGCCDCPIPCKGAHIRNVKVLKKFEYVCERCKYKWTPECCNCNGNCSESPAAENPATGDANTTRGFAPPVSPDFTARVRDLLKSVNLSK